MNRIIILKRFQRIWEYISQNPIISGIISGLIVLIVGGIIMLPKTSDPHGTKKKLTKAQTFLDKGYTERAKDIFSHILLEHRDNNHVTTVALAGQANVYLSQEDFDRAIQYANDAIDVNEHNGDAYIILGRAYSLKGEHEKAIENFNEALERGTKRKEDSYLYRGIEYSYLSKLSLRTAGQFYNTQIISS